MGSQSDMSSQYFIMYIHTALHSVPLEEETATHFSILTWEIPWTEEPGRVQSTGVAKSQTRLMFLGTPGARRDAVSILPPLTLNPGTHLSLCQGWVLRLLSSVVGSPRKETRGVVPEHQET